MSIGNDRYEERGEKECADCGIRRHSEADLIEWRMCCDSWRCEGCASTHECDEASRG